MAATPELSEDIIGTEILTRLPVKSVLRFRSVCKLWKSLFSSSDFIKSHLNLSFQNPNNDSLIINKVVDDIDNLHTYTVSYIGISVLYKYNLSETIVSDLLYPKPSYLQLLGSINGLVCLFNLELKQVILWNPAIRKIKEIYFPSVLDSSVYISGLCWDPVLDDYKVVMCWEDAKKERISPYPENFSADVVCMLAYSCNLDCWTPIPNFSFPASNKSLRPAAIVKGVPLWTFTKYCDEEDICSSSIVKFEAGCHEFKLLPKFDYAMPGQDGFVLVSLKDCLTAMLYNMRTSNTLVDVYCLDEGYGIWIKMYSVGPIPSHVNTLSHCFNYGGEIVFGVFRDFLCYDCTTNKIKGFGNQKGRLLDCYNYIASLVSVDGMEPLHLAKPAYLCGSNKGGKSEDRGKEREEENESEDKQSTKSCCFPWL